MPAAWTVPAAAAPGGAGEISYLRDVRPILANSCFRCHGPDAQTREADLRLDTRDGLEQLTSSGLAVVEPGNPGQSELLRRVAADDPDLRMPPAGEGEPLSPVQRGILARWIDQGAPHESHWGFRPPIRPPLPGAGETSPERSPIDRLVDAALLREGLTPAPEADPATLARRVALDLTGLPPAADEVAQFVALPDPAAYRRLIERYLASPHFGERMAVYWLDLVRYADSCGYHSDVEQPISPYRDYVIDAFNQNLPFDRFTREQLAGDLLPEPTLAQRVATGYNRLNKTTEEGGAQAGEYLAKSAADRVRTTAGVWLAATLGCAECHDHKYDPYSARDFYSFAAFFADVQEQGVYKAGRREPELLVPDRPQAIRLAEIDALLAALDAAGTTPFSETGSPAGPTPEAQQQIERLRAERSELEKRFTRTMVTVAVAPRAMRILPRGNWLDSSGPLVEPAVPSCFASAAATQRLTRLDLAEWLVAADNPLTARVFVNRLWKLFFGAGLVRTLDDLGTQGELPTHPELLDWLAVEFRESGWDVKHMVRLLVTSDAYRRSSIPTAEHERHDPQNRWLARQGRWRLEAEFIRDTALSVAGLLVPTIGGPSVKPYQPEGYWDFLNFPTRRWEASRGEGQYRRGLYTHWQRTFPHPSLLAFDAPSREECTAQRPVSNTPKSALALLNDPTFVEAARCFAARMLSEAPGDDASRIAWGWSTALSRPIDEAERAVLLELLAAQRAHYARHPAAAELLLGVGLAAAPEGLSPIELAAWTGVARAIFNLDEFVSRN